MTQRWLLGLALVSAMRLALAAPGLEEREAMLAASLRCMVCQNQTLAESNAPLAADMRRQIREQLAGGRSEAQIRDYFEERYGPSCATTHPSGLRPGSCGLGRSRCSCWVSSSWRASFGAANVRRRLR